MPGERQESRRWPGNFTISLIFLSIPMLIAKDRRSILLYGLLALTSCSIFISVALNLDRQNLQLMNEPLHSAFEAFGGMAAIFMAILLLQLHREGRREQGEYFPLSLGFFTMGIFDAFHAIAAFGYGFILLRSLAVFIGGCWFAAVWLPGGRRLEQSKTLPWVMIVGSLATGFLILRFRELFPLMIKDGRFTPAAFLFNISSGLLTLSAALYFLREFWRTGKTEAYLFTFMLLFLSLSALEFPLSLTWSRDWWFWHVQRCLGYSVVFYYVLRIFLEARDDLRRANELLEKRIAERTAELTREVAERQRYGRERDQVIAELQGAMAQIKVLTGLLPTCASCKKIRDGEGKWVQMEQYIQNHSEARFSHGICPTCAKQLYPEVYDKIFRADGSARS